MFGAFRFLLALLVVYTHLGKPHGAALGGHAVFGFYALSGFLITRVLNELYNFRLLPFAANRFLRIYPIYFAVAVLTVPALLIIDSPGQFNGRYNLPSGWWPWLKCFLILPTHDLPPFRLVPVSWSIAVEIINYAILWAFTARHVRLAWVAFIVGVCLHGYSLALGEPHNSRYLPWVYASLPFSIGALVYFYREQLAKLLPSAGVVLGVWALILALAYGLNGFRSFGGEAMFYVGLLVIAAAIATLNRLPARVWDQRLGDLAYPIFVTHILVGLVVSGSLGTAGRTDTLFLAALAPMIGLSQALVLLQSRFIEPIRDFVRAWRRGNPVPSGVQPA
jgi:peptidoglycan/LPS O-acetylase OafA/YrhL